MSESLVGSAIAHFQILSELGRGGMGVVYEARDRKLGRLVALKVLPASLAADHARSARFLREARSAAQVTHPCIATVFEIGEGGGQLFIAMERVEGQTLRERLAKGPLDPDQILAIAREIAGALSKAHALGIVHRDLKPENVMLTHDGGVKILDFGIAKALDDDSGEEGRTAWATRDGMILGTPGYMAPEQAAGKKCDQRADVFSFGVLLYELLTRRAPFAGDTPLERVASVLRDPPLPLGEVQVSDAVRALVARCLEKKPEDRPTSGAELASALGQSIASAHTVVRSEKNAVDPMARTLASPAASDLRAMSPQRDVSATSPVATAATTTVPSSVETVRPAGGTRWKGWLVALFIIAASIPVLLLMVRRSFPGLIHRLKGGRPVVVTSSRVSSDSVTSSRSTSAPAAEMPPVLPCEKRPDATFGFECSPRSVAWCDPEGRPVACCGPGLWPTDKNGSCGCPPGGVERDSPAAASCRVVDAKEGLNAAIVKRMVGERTGSFRDCYTRAQNGELPEGRLWLAVRVSPDGRPYSVRIQESSLPLGDTQACLVTEFRGLRFPPPVGVGGASFKVPIEFRSDGPPGADDGRGRQDAFPGGGRKRR